MTLDRATIEAFAAAIQRARPGQASPWDNAGIKSALARCQGEPWEILRAAATSAGNRESRSASNFVSFTKRSLIASA